MVSRRLGYDRYLAGQRQRFGRHVRALLLGFITRSTWCHRGTLLTPADVLEARLRAGSLGGEIWLSSPH
jgi:hypothetical protein